MVHKRQNTLAGRTGRGWFRAGLIEKNEGKANDAGMSMLIGDDFGFSGYLPHGDYAEGLGVYPKLCGISNLQVIHWAAINAATFIGREDELGTAEKGKLTDSLIVDGDPSKDLEILGDRSNIKAVVKNGEFVTCDLPFTRVTGVAAQWLTLDVRFGRVKCFSSPRGYLSRWKCAIGSAISGRAFVSPKNCWYLSDTGDRQRGWFSSLRSIR